MNQKTTWYILAAAVVVAAAVWFVRPGPGDDTKRKSKADKEQPLFDPAPGELTAAEIAVPDRPAMAFAKRDGKWRLTAPIDSQAATFAVDGTVSRIRDLKTEGAFKAGDADRPGDDLTGLNKPIRVKLTDKDGKAYVVKVGRQVPAARQTYIQKEGDETIYVASTDLRPDLEKSLNDYRDRRVTEFTTAEATKLDVAGEQRYVIVRSGESWTLEQPMRGRADKTAIEGLLSAASNLSASAFVEDAPKNLAAYGLEKPALTVVVSGEKKTPKPPPATQSTQPAQPEFNVEPWSVTLAFGAKTGENRFMRVGSGPSVVQVPDAVVKSVAPPLDNLRDKALTRVDVNRASRITVAAAGGTVQLTKNGAVWEFAGPMLNSAASNQAEFSAVDDLLRAVRDLKATGFESDADSLKDFGFNSPRSVVEITAEGAIEPVKLIVGGDTPSGTGVYVRNDREGAIAVVKSDDVTALLAGPTSYVNRDMLTFERLWTRKIAMKRGEAESELAEQGGAWKFTAPVTGDAEASAVNTLLTDLASLRARRIVGSDKDLAAFGLDHPAVRVALTIQAPPPPTSGPASQPTSGPATQPAPAATQPAAPPPFTRTIIAARKDGKAYLHVEGTSVIGEVDGRIFDNLEAECFDRRVTKFQASDVTLLAIARDGQPAIRFERTADDWALAGEPSFACDKPKITETITAFTGLKVVRYVSYQSTDLAAHGLDKPQLGVTIRTPDGLEQELLIAPKGPPTDTTGQRYATLKGSGRIFLIGKDDYAKLDKEVKSFQRAQ